MVVNFTPQKSGAISPFHHVFGSAEKLATDSTSKSKITPEKSSPPPDGKRRTRRCKVCHVEHHDVRTCPRYNVIPSTRPGIKRTVCKKMSLTSRHIQRLELFTKAIPDSGREKDSVKLLNEAKKVVIQEIDRLQALVEADEISGYERAWFEASGETQLWFHFGGMRHNVMNARFGIQDMDDDTDGYNNFLEVILNKNKPMNQDEIQQTLLHECMHHNVTRKEDSGNLNDNIDHLALALLGDPNERASFKMGWLSCVFSKCKSPCCHKYDLAE